MKVLRVLLLPIGLAASFTVPNAVKVATPPLYLEKPRPYIPQGFSIENWAAFKGTEKKNREQSKKKRHFQSRPLVDFQKDLEAGKVRHLFPVMFAKQRVQKGELRPSDVPYEQREGGKYDNKDVNVGYIPSGMSVHEWHGLQTAEKRKQQAKNFAAFGPTSFKSRSLQGFQEDLDKGKVKHLFPTMFAKERVKEGQIKEEDVPYMQCGGSWDNSDVKSAKKKKWSETDKKMESLPSWLRRGPLAP
mmetsp:Transcript_11579/g.21390  ORF Transcript_11579/g.21390 Transcript_11579/m.21390 type:complete len:245 (-) Transcript_11579:99-833(-)